MSMFKVIYNIHMSRPQPWNINEKLSLKYQQQFFGHFANPINELLFDNISTLYRTDTKDFLILMCQFEYLRALHPALADSQLVNREGRQFEFGLKCQLPLIITGIMTDTSSILKRRKRRFKKYFTGQSSSSQQMSICQESSIHSKFSHQTVIMLKQNLSNISLDLSSSYQNYYGSSICDIYSINQHQNLQLADQISLEKPINFRLQTSEIAEIQMKHLVFDYEEEQQSKLTSLHNIYQQHLVQKQQVEIRSILKAELLRYNIAQPSSINSVTSTMPNKCKKKIRQKAQDLLKVLSSANRIM